MDGKQTVSYKELLARDGRFVYTVKGVSMLPLLRQRRDLIRVERRDPARYRKYDVVLFTRPRGDGGEDFVLHRIVKRLDGGAYWIVGDNCVSGDTVPEENILGVMTAFTRNGKTISVTNPGYRLYVALWCAPYRLRMGLLRIRAFAARQWRKLSKRMKR